MGAIMKQMTTRFGIIAFSIICSAACNKPHPTSKASVIQQLADEDLVYDTVAEILRESPILVSALGTQCSDFAIGSFSKKKVRDALPKTVGGVFQHFESFATLKRVKCAPLTGSWSCELEASNGDDFSALLRFELTTTGAIKTETITCSLAG